jgi:hypothetical protein
MLHNFPSRVKSLDGAAEFRARTIHSSNGKFAQLSAWHLTAVTCDGKAVPKFRHRQVVEAPQWLRQWKGRTLAPTPQAWPRRRDAVAAVDEMEVRSAPFYGAADDASGWRILTRRRLLWVVRAAQTFQPHDPTPGGLKTRQE